MQVLTIGKFDYYAQPLTKGGFLITRGNGRPTYIIQNGVQPLDPSKRYYAQSLTGGRMTYQGNPRLFTVDEEGLLVLAN